MKTFIIICTLFVIGSSFGYLIELLYRRIVAKKWINPGFLVGPYLPIYGFGTIFLYFLSNIKMNINPVWENIIKVLLIGVSLTLIEFIAGLIFIKKFKLKLWDYSNFKGNIMGIICPLFSIIWLVIGVIYFFLINPYLVEFIGWLSEHIIYSFFVGVVIGMMIIDLAYSIHLATRISNLRQKQGLRFEEYKLLVKTKLKNIKKMLYKKE